MRERDGQLTEVTGQLALATLQNRESSAYCVEPQAKSSLLHQGKCTCFTFFQRWTIWGSYVQGCYVQGCYDQGCFVHGRWILNIPLYETLLDAKPLDFPLYIFFLCWCRTLDFALIIFFYAAPWNFLCKCPFPCWTLDCWLYDIHPFLILEPWVPSYMSFFRCWILDFLCIYPSFYAEP